MIHQPGSPKPVRVLLTGLPRSGKTTLVRRLVEGYRGRAAGFYTQEVRQHGARVGFEIVTLEGAKALLSHVDFPGPKRVGKYGVNLENLHRLGLPAMEPVAGVDLIVVDEIGKMECLSPLFVIAMERLLEAPVNLLATVALKGSGYIEAVKRQPGITLLTITPANRDALLAELRARLDQARGPGP